MKKANKILMATVAILLSLVLLSTSIVSGIFARFVIKHTATTAITLGRFGVDVSLIPKTSALQNAGADVELVKDEANNILSATVTGLKMIPGMEFPDAFKIQFDGTTNVDVKVSIDFCFQYDIEEFHVPAGVGTLNNSGNGRNFMPIGFTFGAYNDSTSVVGIDYIKDSDSDKTNNITPYNYLDKNTTENYFANGIANLIDVNAISIDSPIDNAVEDEKTDYRIYKEFRLTDGVPKDIAFYSDLNGTAINTLIFGFNWPLTYSSQLYGADTLDLVGTYLASKQYEKTISFTYTIKLEQITG